MASQEPIRKRTTTGANTTGGSGGPSSGSPPQIPDKLYFRIGEVAKLCDVPAYVLRFWEGEFPQLKPNKGGTGQRLFRRKDVEMALRIKRLLYDEGYTIPGARQAFKAELRAASATDPTLAPGAATPAVDAQQLNALRKELEDLHRILSKPPALRSTVQSIRSSRSFSASTPDLEEDFPDERPEKPRLASPAPKQFPKPTLVTPKSPVGRLQSLFDSLPFDD
jgi:DNA-binding transcriptional MerR regulator